MIKTFAQSIRIVRISRDLILTIALLLLITVIAIQGLMVGTPPVSLEELWALLVHGEGGRLARLTVLQLRLPRLCLGAMAGALLALSGALLQSALRNMLAGPELLGVSAGASAVMAAIIVLGLPAALSLHPWYALLGALSGGAVVLIAARRTRDPLRIVLIGAALTALLNALVVAIISLGSRNAIGLLFLFLLGSLANRTWEHVAIVLPWALICMPLTFVCARPLNLLQLGDETAEGLGLRVLWVRLGIGMVAASMVAAVVAVCGPIGWIALLAPHIVRQALGTSDARRVLPLAALTGVMLLLAADLLGRILFAPIEISVGVWTTLVGGPILLLLVRRQLHSLGGF